MQPNSEPSAADVALVAASMGQVSPQETAPVTPVADMQPAPVTPQPSPTSQQASDPFASLFATPEPVAPVVAEPVAPSQVQPTEVVAPVAPAIAPVVSAPVDDFQSYDDYMKQALANVPPAPILPDVEQIDPNNPEAIKTFFDELVNTAVTRAESNSARKDAIQQTERKLWDESFNKYGTLRENIPLRDMVHNIRMGYFNRGIAITPTQAADKLLESLGSQYKQGVADGAVITTIEDVQPNGGNTGAPVATSLDRENVLTSIQTGGEQALAAYLDVEVKAGRL